MFFKKTLKISTNNIVPPHFVFDKHNNNHRVPPELLFDKHTPAPRDTPRDTANTTWPPHNI